jgi:CHAT domain-containing protein
LGFAYTQIGRYPLALQYLQNALDEVKPNSPDYARVCRYMGILQQAKGDLWSALEWKQKSLISLSAAVPNNDLLDNPPISTNGYIDFLKVLTEKATILQLLAQKESKLALLEAAHSSLDLATVVLDSMRTIYQEGSKQFWNEEARPMLENAIDLALQLHQSTGNTIYLAKAFAYAEKGKAYLLSESLRESAARQKAGIPQGVIQEEKQIKIDIAFYHKQIFEAQQLKNTDNPKIPLWQSEILRLHRNQEDLLARMEKDFPEYYQIKYKQQISSIRDLQGKLPVNTGLLEFFQGDHAVYAFYLDQQQAYARRCVPDSSLTHLLRDLRNQDTVLSRGRGPVAVQTFVRDAHSLYQNLVAAVVPQIPTNLIIIPDGQLAYLPFDLLVTENVDTKDQPKFATLPYLLRKTTIRYEYSAFLAFQPLGNNHAEYFFDGYAPDYNPKLPEASGRDGKNGCLAWQTTDFAPLANNQQEVEAIAQITEGNALLGSAATEEGFRKNSQKPRILHLAMHGFLNDCDPAYSGLVFSPSTGQDSVQEDNDGILHAFEIYNLHLNAELAVLSACNTGRGKMAKGEGVISLARAFKYAGCPNILMSLWQADDRATASIMTHFYEHLNRGLGKAEAIRQAKLDYLGGSAQNHPFFWAAFVLIGDNEPLEAAIPWLWYGVLGFGMLLLGLFLWQKMHIK